MNTPNPKFPTDSIGRQFDAAKFRLGDDGRPRLDSQGRFVNQNSGRPKKTANSASGAAHTSAGSTPMPDFSDVDRIASGKPAGDELTPERVAAAIENPTAETVLGILQTALVLIGDEEGVLSDGEKLALRPPLVRVLKKYNVGADVMPAEVELALAVAMLLVTRLQRPKTATWFAKAKAWAVNLFFRGKGELLRREIRREVGDAGGQHEPAQN